MGVLGFEPRTSALSELRSSQLSYTPAKANKKAKPQSVWPYPALRMVERQPVPRMSIARCVMDSPRDRSWSTVPNRIIEVDRHPSMGKNFLLGKRVLNRNGERETAER